LETEKVGVHAWIEVGVAVALLLMAVGGTYLTLNTQVVDLQSRVNYLETEGVRQDERSYEVMSKLSDSVDRLNVSMARIEERLKATETKSN
tara:strand:- start:817 stop:1089 length:273 start_codon:yes stop_codon:yes gene_type:complete